LVLHGGDSPIVAWKEAVITSFNLQGSRVNPIFDEHEQQLPDDVKALIKLFGPFRTYAEKQQGSPAT
jgi:hypothetical protein